MASKAKKLRVVRVIEEITRTKEAKKLKVVRVISSTPKKMLVAAYVLRGENAGPVTRLCLEKRRKQFIDQYGYLYDLDSITFPS